MTCIDYVLIGLGIYVAIGIVVYLFTRDLDKSVFWIFSLLGEILENMGDAGGFGGFD